MPVVRVPFLRSAGEADLEHREEADMPREPEESQASVPEEFIQLEPLSMGFKGKAKGKGWGKSKTPKTEAQELSGFKRARAALQGVASQPPATEAAQQVLQVQVEAQDNATPAAKDGLEAASPLARENAEETSMTIFDFFDGMEG